jgi:hypothetical protein
MLRLYYYPFGGGPYTQHLVRVQQPESDQGVDEHTMYDMRTSVECRVVPGRVV